MSDIDTGDLVRHIPSGEQWVVACVSGEYLYWCGWPYGDAKLSDCALIQKASEGEKSRILESCAQMNDDNDYRCRNAKRVLAESRTIEEK